jgi:hypothetical protein
MLSADDQVIVGITRKLFELRRGFANILYDCGGVKVGHTILNPDAMLSQYVKRLFIVKRNTDFCQYFHRLVMNTLDTMSIKKFV